LKTKVGDITKEHDLMTEGVVKKGGVIDALKAEIEQVDGLTGAYANVRD